MGTCMPIPKEMNLHWLHENNDFFYLDAFSPDVIHEVFFEKRNKCLSA